jgi:dTDP-4-amino-4,6-dideoxygalactose transaminase
LKHLNEYNLARQNAAAFYDNAFKNIPQIETPSRFGNSSHIFHQYTILLKDVDREGLKNYLQDKGIPSMVYYPVPLHSQNAYKYLGYKDSDFPVTEDLSKRVLSLPMHTELDQPQLTHITSSIIEFLAHGK